MEILMHSIGIIHSPFIEKSQTPIQASRSQAKGVVDVYMEYAEGLQDLEGFSHIILLYAFHKSLGYSLLVNLSSMITCAGFSPRATLHVPILSGCRWSG
jgi:tRNA (Thr-GGU) A37 N-methylase